MRPSTLLTDATGYFGRRLLKLLEAENHPVRRLTWRFEFLQNRAATENEVVAGNWLELR
jgi:uncharacterized protein YbjT (DUF2867 family)